MDRIENMRLFTEVARTGSFTAAAEVVGKPVQTVSKAVRQLEAQLKVLLFDRTTRSVALTDTGRAYLDRCLDLLDQFDELDSAVRSEHEAPRGRIRMTAPTTFGERNLLPVLADFLSLHPDIKIELSLSNLKVSLIDEGFDLAIRIGQLQDSSLIARHLAPMRKVVCAAPDFLQKHGTPANPLALSHYPCLIDTNFEDPHTWPFKIEGQQIRVDIEGPFNANTPEATRQMAKAGIGIALCPMYVIEQDLADGTLVPLFEPFEASEMGIYALYPHRRHLSARVRALVNFLEHQF